MALKPRIAIIGNGRLGTALALELARAGYRISQIAPGRSRSSRRNAGALAGKLNSHVIANDARLNANLVWFCVPDGEIAKAARQYSKAIDWKSKVAFHSSGALSSDELKSLRNRGAAVASVHPLMTFVDGSVPSLKGVTFALEGDPSALRTARSIVRNLGAESFSLFKKNKLAYHAWGTLASPLLIALLVTGERVARAARISSVEARRRMLPIVRQTLNNYAKLGPAGASSGPIVRGDAQSVRQHLAALRKIPEARAVYSALARAALRYLPGKNSNQLKKLMGKPQP
jgi:predicted short-subunit dehydrogenase-like oxidoreductase (DUF2520 family)